MSRRVSWTDAIRSSETSPRSLFVSDGKIREYHGIDIGVEYVFVSHVSIVFQRSLDVGHSNRKCRVEFGDLQY